MELKEYVNAVAPSTGRRYSIVSVGNDQSTITDVTSYVVTGSSFGASDIVQTCLLPFNHAKSGTVHQLTSPNTGAVNIRFVATASYASGDTFTVNGTQVTAQLQNGSALPGNFFVTGAVVTCYLNGSTLNFSTGGAGEAFQIVGGTTQPTNPSNVTVWINTDSAISGWEFSSTEPDAPQTGTVWINTGTASPAAFNAVRDNVLMVYPTGAYQYVGSAWQPKEGMVYVGGEWVSLATYLLQGSDLHTENGGTWSNAGGWSAISGTGWVYNPYSITGDGIVINNPSSEYNVRWSICGKQEPMSFEGYSKLTFVYNITATTTDNLYFAVTTQITNINTGVTAARTILPKGQTVGSYTQTLDVSSLNGSYYVAFALLRQGGILLREVYLT